MPSGEIPDAYVPQCEWMPPPPPADTFMIQTVQIPPAVAQLPSQKEGMLVSLYLRLGHLGFTLRS